MRFAQTGSVGNIFLYEITGNERFQKSSEVTVGVAARLLRNFFSGVTGVPLAKNAHNFHTGFGVIEH